MGAVGGRGRSASGACISPLWRASHRFHIGVLENLHIAKRTAGEGEHVEAKVFCDSPFEWVEGDAAAHAEELHGRAGDHKGQAGSHKKERAALMLNALKDHSLYYMRGRESYTCTLRAPTRNWSRVIRAGMGKWEMASLLTMSMPPLHSE